MCGRRILLFLIFNLKIALTLSLGQGCAGLGADAGPDLFTCDPSMPVQLMGTFNGMPTKIYWTPDTYLSDANVTDPIVNAPVGKYKYTFNVEAVGTTNLITNGNFESGNSGFSHDYNYGMPGGPFSPGWLSVGTDPIAYNTGFTNCGDHTTGTGNQLIVDGHTTPNSNLWCQTVAVTTGKMYLFRFYVQCVYPVAPPQLIALANGASFGAVSGGAVCDWIMFEGCFTATSGSVQLCIQETSLVGFGNDFAIDDIELYEKCVETDEVEVEVVDVKAKIQTGQLPKCSSDIFDLNAIGSSAGANIRYEWRSEGGKIVSQNGLTAKGQGSGKYFVKVLYKNGNVECEKEVEIDVDASDDLEGTLEVEGIANCNLDTIVLRATASNGSRNFSYNWIPANKIHRGQKDSVAYVTEAGLYKVVIIDTDSGCEVEIQGVVVSDTLKPNVSISGDSLISCKNAFIKLKGSPFDTSRFTYEWLLPDSSKLTNIDSIASSLAGTFTIKIIDKTNDCTLTDDWYVKIDTIKPQIELGPDLIIDCFNNEVSITPIGNNPNSNLSYYWSLPSGYIIDTQLQIKKETSGGNVILRLINSFNGCETSDTLKIKDVRKLPYVDAGMDTILTCSHDSILLDGLNSDWKKSIFYWYNDRGNTYQVNQGGIVVDTPGWYYFYVEDSASHCNNFDSVFVDVNKVKPKIVIDTPLVFTCADTSLIIDATKSTQGSQLKYKWTTINGNIASGQNTQLLIIKSAGEYLFTIEDTINGCADNFLFDVVPDLNTPIASITIDDTLNCIQQSVILIGSASSPSGDSIKYTWSSSNGQFIQNPNSLTPSVTEPGQYILNVIDLVNGCSATAIANVSIDTIKPTANAGPDSVWYCSTFLLNLDGSNSSGNHSLQYEWTTPDGSILTNNKLPAIDVGRPGTYNLKVTDLVNGCESTDQTIIHPDLVVPSAYILVPLRLTCKNPTVTVSGQGSSTGNRIIYSWSTAFGNIVGATNQIDIVVDKPGTYVLSVIDTVNNCVSSQSMDVAEDKEHPIADAGNPVELTCKDLDIILLGTVRNTIHYQTFWKTTNGDTINYWDSAKINTPGWYYFIVTDLNNGCSGIDSVEVTKINNLIVDAGGSAMLTCLVKDLNLTGSMQNNAGNEQITWTTSQGNFIGNVNTQQVKVDRPGWYYFVVSNNITGCNGIDSVLVTENTNVPVSLELDIDQPLCPGDSWQTDILNVIGGEQPVQVYLDNQLVNSPRLQGNVYGNHTIKVIDKNGCELSTVFNIITPVDISVQLIPLVKLTAGQDYNLIPTYSIPDDSIATINWSPADFLSCTDCPYPIVKGINRDMEYIVSYTNRNGCIATARIRIELVKRDIWIPNAFSPNGDNINDRFLPVVTEDAYNEIRLLQIYDRWGNQLFSQEHFQLDDPYAGWNGITNQERANPGVYVYLIEVEWKTGEVEKRFGDITLIK